MKIENLYAQDILEGDYIPEFRYYYYRMFDKPYDMPPHQHPQVEIMYVEQGNCTVHLQKESFSLKRNEFILINGNIPHGMVVTEGQSCRILNIEYAFVPNGGSFFSIRDLVEKLGKIPEVFRTHRTAFVLKDTEEVYSTLKRIVYELDTPGPSWEFQVNILFWQLVLSISKLLEEGKQHSSSSSGHYYIQKALRYIHSNYYQDIDVDAIAGWLKLNRSYFHRIFKEVLGCTPVEYLTELRMRRARVLLTRTDLPILDVSKNLGIQSQQYFTYLFKKHHGVSPGSYRKQYQINKIEE
jgi:AraC-like DNA-binding protein